MKFSAYAESEIKFVPKRAQHISHGEAIFHCRRQFHSFRRNEFHCAPKAKSGFLSETASFLVREGGVEPEYKNGKSIAALVEFPAYYIFCYSLDL